MRAGSGFFYGLFLLWLRRLRYADPIAITFLNCIGVAIIFAVIPSSAPCTMDGGSIVRRMIASAATRAARATSNRLTDTACKALKPEGGVVLKLVRHIQSGTLSDSSAFSLPRSACTYG